MNSANSDSHKLRGWDRFTVGVSDSRKIYIEKCCLMEPCIKYCISREVDGHRHSLLIRNWGKLPLYLWFHCYHQRAREVHSGFVMNRGDCNDRGNCKPCRQGGVRIERMIWEKSQRQDYPTNPNSKTYQGI